jgi:hypothetical protein
VTLPVNFRIPFLREIYLMLGLLDASKETFKTILTGGPGDPSPQPESPRVQNMFE